MSVNKDKVLERFPYAVCEYYEVGGFRNYSISMVVTRTNDGAFADCDAGKYVVLGGGNTEAGAWRDAYDRIFPLNLATGMRKPIL